jgi:hypothetical protein
MPTIDAQWEINIGNLFNCPPFKNSYTCVLMITTISLFKQNGVAQWLSTFTRSWRICVQTSVV